MSRTITIKIPTSPPRRNTHPGSGFPFLSRTSTFILTFPTSGPDISMDWTHILVIANDCNSTAFQFQQNWSIKGEAAVLSTCSIRWIHSLKPFISLSLSKWSPRAGLSNVTSTSCSLIWREKHIISRLLPIMWRSGMICHMSACRGYLSPVTLARQV